MPAAFVAMTEDILGVLPEFRTITQVELAALWTVICQAAVALLTLSTNVILSIFNDSDDTCSSAVDDTWTHDVFGDFNTHSIPDDGDVAHDSTPDDGGAHSLFDNVDSWAFLPMTRRNTFQPVAFVTMLETEIVALLTMNRLSRFWPSCISGTSHTPCREVPSALLPVCSAVA